MYSSDGTHQLGVIDNTISVPQFLYNYVLNGNNKPLPGDFRNRSCWFTDIQSVGYSDGSSWFTNGGGGGDATNNVKFFGVKGDGITDDTVNIQSAVNALALIHVPVFFPVGTFLISSDIIIPSTIEIIGESRDYTIIKVKPGSSVNSVISLPHSQMSDTNTTSRSTFSKFTIDGSSIAQYGMLGVTNHSIFRDMRVFGTVINAIDISYGWCNNFENVELSSNIGNGLDLSRFSGANGNFLSNCKIFNNNGFGIIVKGANALGIGNGTTIELNKKGGILILSSSTAVDIGSGSCYFEGNGITGVTFTSPENITIHANIIVCDSMTSLNNAYPSQVNIHNCFTNPYNSDYFIYSCNGDSLTVTDNNSYTPVTLLGCYGSDSWYPSYGYIKDTVIKNNTGFSTGNIKVLPLTLSVLDYTGLAETIYDDNSLMGNIVPVDFDLWSVITVLSVRSSFYRSSSTFPYNKKVPVWVFDVGIGQSDIIGFTINAADYPEYSGKYMCFSAWIKSPYNSNNGRFCLYTNSATPTTSYSSNTDWTLESRLFIFPSSGIIKFGIGKFGAAGIGLIACPVLSELGSGLNNEINNSGQKTKFLGTAAPTAGTWLVNDRMTNTVPTTGQPKSWVCTVAGSPGTWVSEGNL